MKNSIQLLSLFLLFLTSSCVINDDDIHDHDFIDNDTIGATYELETNFSAQENSVRFTFPNNIVKSDVVLVYRLEAQDNGLDVWEPLPTATIFFDDGSTLIYRYNFTLGDVDIILENDNIDALSAEYINRQVFRIVVVPANFANSNSVNLKNLHSVLSALKINENNISKVSLD
ncbi:hypothetical protein HN014_17185 [Aquimarina sp. TRL1]|uniref:hypothetical protein n=1 Tax=Aquimarina sp. (strain TRL1) TaxID=2736252 RepID=UPI00158A5096|nr:hypothetical protein [Aquimarina sp. TRL1]QKX06574.1 hypothetical protein HN014_17185 [Aquimarina sp. TRL1]